MNIENYSASQVFGNAALKARFLKAYKAEFGKEVCTTCPAELTNAFYELKTKLNNRNMEKQPLYSLKKGQKLNVLDIGYISEANFSDEIAETLLARNKAYLQFMATYPDNWEERVYGTPDKSVSKPAAPEEDKDSVVHTNIPAEEQAATEILASDAAKKLAKEHGIDLATIKGSGKGGNITKADVQAAIG